MSSSPLMDLVRARSSVRRFDPRPVDDADILSIMEAARLAPSAENSQPWRFVVVKDPGARERLFREAFSGIHAYSRRIVAPVYIALCVQPGIVERAARVAQGVSYAQLDCGIAGEHLILRAAELGLGTCWIGWFDRRRARKTLGIPARATVVSLIALGHPAEGTAQRPRMRKPLSSMVSLDAWGREYPGAGAQGNSEK